MRAAQGFHDRLLAGRGQAGIVPRLDRRGDVVEQKAQDQGGRRRKQEKAGDDHAGHGQGAEDPLQHG